MNNILMVCVGNICRSPMAEGLLKHYLQQQGMQISVASAGLAAVVGSPADPNAIDVMKRFGIDISQHQPRQVTIEIVQQADLVLVMEAWQQKELSCISPAAYGKIHRLGKWGDFDVPDPYRKPVYFFEKTYELLDQGLQTWQQKIIEIIS